MQLLAITLQELPAQLDDTAKKFKEVYPDGVFSVRMEIDIRTNAKDDNPMDLVQKWSDGSESAEGEDRRTGRGRSPKALIS